MKLFIKLIALSCVVLMMVACDPDSGNKSETAENTVNLLSAYSFADKMGETGILNFSTAFSTYYLHEGWKHPYDSENPGEVIAAATARNSVLRFNILRKHDRWLQFTARSKGKYGGPNRQWVDVLIEGNQLDRIELTPDDKEFQLFIPANLQKVGDNFVTFRHSVLEKNEDFIRSRKLYEKFPFPYIAGYFFDFKLKIGDETEPFYYETPDEINTFTPVGDGKFLSQKSPSELTYAFEVKGKAQLSIAGSVQSVTGDEETVTVEASVRTDEKQDFAPLYTGEFEFGQGQMNQPFSDVIDLNDYENQIISLRIKVDTTREIPQTSVIWKEMKLSLPSTDEEKGKEQKPIRAENEVKNVIIIILDAARPENYGCYGSDLEATTHIDEFARDAIVFDNAVAAAPYTITSISSLFSGLLPETHGVRKISQKYPEDLESMPKSFIRSGYYTVALAGTKFIEPEYGLTKPFDYTVYLRESSDKVDNVTTMNPVEMEAAVKKASESGKPVFLYAHFLPPHWPYRPPAPFDKFYIEPSKKVQYHKAWQIKGLLEQKEMDPDDEDVFIYLRRYYNNLRYGDYVTHQLLELLKKYDLYENSLIILTSDHGESFGEHREFGHNSSVYEEMVRIPFIAKVPGQASKRIKQQIGLIDLFPTFAELFNLEVENVNYQGRSIAPLLTGNEQQYGDYYYSRAFYATKLYFMMRGEQFKYIQNDHLPYLFDITNDPDEQINLVDKYPVLTMYLRQKGLIQLATNERLNAGKGEDVELSKEDEEELRNLGYIN